MAEILAILLVILFVKNAHKSAINLYMVILSFMLILFVFSMHKSGFLGNLLLKQIPMRTGRYSYSIYMWNAIVISIAYNTALYGFKIKCQEIIPGAVSGIVFKYAWVINCSIISILFALSSLTYRFIEMPFRNTIKNWRHA
jgi:peptidoglycan/LPS O-acetylase OafA/YrhL